MNKELDAKLEAARLSTCNPAETRARLRRMGKSVEGEESERPLLDRLRQFESGW